MVLYEFKDLTYYYPQNSEPVLKGLDLNLEEGEFILLVGHSGSGKSSLLRMLGGLIPDFYGGRVEGSICYRGQKLRDWNRPALAQEVGMVFQNPEKQLLFRSVEREIAFGLENLGIPGVEMRRRIAEVMDFFGLHGLKQPQSTIDLSGGEKQKLVLASVVAMQPRVLLLDEPTSQLDPVAAEEILNLVKKLNEELGITVILVEQRLERCLHLADRTIVMGKGQIEAEGTPEEIVAWLAEKQNPFIPPVAKLFANLGFKPIPLTVKQGRRVIRKIIEGNGVIPKSDDKKEIGHLEGIKSNTKKAINLQKVWFSYPDSSEVLRGINLEIEAGEFVAIMGANGAGKSTLLRHLTALLQPDRGRVEVLGHNLKDLRPAEAAHWVGYLAQNPNHYLLNDTVEAELCFTLQNLGIKQGNLVDETLQSFDLTRYREANPRNLGEGEKQRVALASVLVSQPLVLLLDEPTRGMDWLIKNELGRLLKSLQHKKITILLVTHDIEFVAEYADRVILMYQGSIVADGSKHEVLSRGMFYAPQLNKLFQGVNNQVITHEDALKQMEAMAYDK